MKPICVVSCPIDTFSGYGARSRDFVKALIQLKDKKWDRNKFLGTELYKKQLGLIGFGKAAKEVAKRLTAFGMDIVFYDPYVEASEDEANKVELDELL